MTLTAKVKAYFASFTIEPSIFIWIIGISVAGSTQIMTDLLIWKVCKSEVGYNDTICEDLDDYPEEQDEVMIAVNTFSMKKQWVQNAPTVVYSLIVGGLSDDFGRKPLIYVPLFGSLLSAIIQLLICIFIEQLPVEAFYADTIYAYCGGMPVYYMGVYSYGSSVTTPEERPHRLARLDGVERFGLVLGALLSIVFLEFGSVYVNLGVNVGCSAAAFCYVVFCVKEPLQRKSTKVTEEGEEVSIFKRFLLIFKRYILTPMVEIFVTLVRKRDNGLRWILYLMFVAFGIYWFVVEEHALIYFYLLDTIPDFTGTEYAIFGVYSDLLGMVALLVGMPLIAGKFRIHESMILVGLTFMSAGSSLCTAFASTLWQFYLAQFGSCINICLYSIARSLFTRAVNPNEVGKIFGFVALMVATVPLLGNLVYRELYNHTLDTFPSAFLLLSAACLTLAMFINFIIYTQRRRFLTETTAEDPQVFDHEDISGKDNLAFQPRLPNRMVDVVDGNIDKTSE